MAANPGGPLVTFYDALSGERTELSATTYANWVAKTASYFVEECDLERGDHVDLALPTHWLGPVLLGACWTVGLTVGPGNADAAVIGPEVLPSDGARAATVIACALKPMAGRFDHPLPPGVRDFGVEIWSQPDAFYHPDPPTVDDPAIIAAEDRRRLAPGDRLLSQRNPVTDPLDFAEVVVRRGSMVLVANADAPRLESIAEAERVTVRG